MKSNSKEVKQRVLNHIIDYVNDWDYENCITIEDKVKSQIDYMKCSRDSIFDTCKRLVEGGTFLVYNGDIEEFLLSLELNNNSKKVFDEWEMFKLYVLLLARELENIYYKGIK